MTVQRQVTWSDANQRHLVEAVAGVRAILAGDAATAKQDPGRSRQRSRARKASVPGVAIEPASALEHVSVAFGLSPFERRVLLMCAGMELDATFAGVVAGARHDDRRVPTFGLALAALPDAHWSALTPAAPLRHWRLIELAPGESLTDAALRIDERVLHCLTGVSYIDERLRPYVEPVAAPDDLVASQRTLLTPIVSTWTSRTSALLPLVRLCGQDEAAARSVAAAACGSVGLRLYAMSAGSVPRTPVELETFMRLWQRETVLSACALLVDWNHVEPADASRDAAVTQLLEQVQGCLIVSSRTRHATLRRRMVTLDLTGPSRSEQRDLWRRALGPASASLNGQLDGLVSQFDFGAAAIDSVCADAMRQIAEGHTHEDALWRACRERTRHSVEGLAQRIVSAARWDDLVLPDLQMQTLRQIAVHVRHRATVYDTWGFAARESRGLGISALFAGPSGTGKTMAGEVLAGELNLDLYRVDLSQVVSKYIGETEKNLSCVFDAAEKGGGILLFDEADALFGKRSDVKDSHDRYANVEVSYLLQRMEAYRGLAILTTNMKGALDPAFMRRIRFVVHFPFPEAQQRAEIWRRVFPARHADPRARLREAREARHRRREHQEHGAQGRVPRRRRRGAGGDGAPAPGGAERMREARTSADRSGDRRMAMTHRDRVRSRTAPAFAVPAQWSTALEPGRDVDVRIAELAVDGVRPADARPLGDAVQRELHQLFVARGVPPALTIAGNRDRIGAAVRRWPSHASAARVGASIAQAVYDGLAGDERRPPSVADEGRLP